MPAALSRRVLRYGGERGPALQHLGPLIGPAAHVRLRPEILDWVSICWLADPGTAHSLRQSGGFHWRDGEAEAPEAD